jgi:hypothetical protein
MTGGSLRSRWRTAIVLGLVGLYLSIYLGFSHLNFSIRKDELHFWPTSLSFSHHLVPRLEDLRNYDDLNTPLPFVVFGELEQAFGQGIWLARLTNLVLSFAGLLLIFFSGRSPSRGLRSVLGLLLCPYFVAVSTHVYTDIFTLFFILVGFASLNAGASIVAGLAFLAAISSRQYAVVFPFVLGIWFLSRRVIRGEQVEGKTWAMPLFATLGLAGWFLFFGGPAPRIAMHHQFIATAHLTALLFQNTAYFLSVVGAYFVLPEAVLFPASRREWWPVEFSLRTGILVAMLSLLFLLFPPIANLAPYPYPEMGYLDKLLRAGLGTPARVVVLYFLALFTVLRFRRLSLAAWLVFGNALLMAKAHIAWDKYALPLLAVLWWLRAKDGELSAPGNESAKGLR